MSSHANPVQSNFAQHLRPRWPVPLLRLLIIGGLGLCMGVGIAETPANDRLNAPAQVDPGNVIDTLKKLPVPAPPPEELAKVVQDRAAAIQLGKALFWDTRVGSDHRTACASCHFNGGADSRSRNQLAPGLLAGDRTFQLGGPNYQLKPDDFPFTRHADINDVATRIADLNDIVSSQGVLTRKYIAAVPTTGPDKCSEVSDALIHGGTGFNVNGVNTRRVEPRNAPTVINAVFNFRTFWDGRANNMFNGGDPFGLRNPSPMVWRTEDGNLRLTAFSLRSSSLASLSAGPPLSRDEMSCAGRAFANLGRKLTKTYFLWDQAIDPRDSVLAPYARYRITYGDLIRRAFRPEYWNARQQIILSGSEGDAPHTVDLQPTRPGMGMRARSGGANGFNGTPADQYTQMEANFALFFGLAVQLYQSTLVADDSPFDRFKDGNKTALNAQQIRGLGIFTSAPANCFLCHSGPALTSASFKNVKTAGRLGSLTRADGTPIRFDTGFFNIGVRPTAEDPGLGGRDPFGLPLSETRMSQLGKTDLLGNGFDPQTETAVPPDAFVAVDGAFKTPGLRNVEFTGPYFHNGGKATLMQVVDFYNRGGDFARENQPLTSGAIRPLGLTQEQKNDLVAFLLALSDDRVRYQRAPFDHPSICLAEGHLGNQYRVQVDRSGRAVDQVRCIGAVGAAGLATPIGRFLNLDPFQR